MKYIAHRGNIKGKNPEMENNPEYIEEAMKQGFDVEIDIWYEKNKYYLGHSRPQYEIELKWIMDNSEFLWCHAKNLEALRLLLHYGQINVFWHQEDSFTLTSHGFIWTYPEEQILSYDYKQIILLFDWTYDEINIPHGGICSDEIILYRNKYNA